MTPNEKDKLCVKAGMELYNALADISKKYKMSSGMSIGVINAMVLYLFNLIGHDKGREALRDMHKQQLQLFDTYYLQEKNTDA